VGPGTEGVARAVPVIWGVAKALSRLEDAGPLAEPEERRKRGENRKVLPECEGRRAEAAELRRKRHLWSLRMRRAGPKRGEWPSSGQQKSSRGGCGFG